MIKLTPENFGTLAICAIRYCHGRQTYMPSLVQDIVRAHLSELEDRDLHVMLNDCEDMREYDYGDPRIDKPGWLKWKEDLDNERNERSGLPEVQRR